MRMKTLRQLTIELLAHIHLDLHGLPTTLAGGWIVSGLEGLVTEILQSRSQLNARIFSPVHGSFALLDQIGSCYTTLSMPQFGARDRQRASPAQAGLRPRTGMRQITAETA